MPVARADEREGAGTTPAYIADWWRDGTAAIETGMATVGRRSGTINTRDAVGVKKKAELVERGPKHPNR
jgi:hypothetical protein